MIVLERSSASDGAAARQVILLFGVGLIGRSIAARLGRFNGFTARRMIFSWDRPEQRVRDSAAVGRYVAALMETPLRNAGNEARRVDVVWAAGTSGFSSTTKQTQPELEAFDDVLALAHSIRERLPQARHAFHLVSSAGALFEGQRLVDASCAPRAASAYGTLKLAQERRLATLGPQFGRFVYRPSTVYGFAGDGMRLGLVRLLIQNAVRQRVSSIYGAPHTLRDYVLAADIGRYVAARLTSPATGSGVFLLASAKPCSLFEMIRRVERATNRRLYLKFDPHSFNSSDNSYAAGALPADWHPTDLGTGIFQTALELFRSFAQPARASQ
jgi:UDP-glucose 4-epimerase